MGLCEEFGIERDDYSEDISDDEWARRWEERRLAREAAMTPVQRLVLRIGQTRARVLFDLLESVERDHHGDGRRMLELMTRNE